MKVIDLLNKKANGEKLPKKIKFDNMVWYKITRKKCTSYVNKNKGDLFIYIFKRNLTFTLNDEVEILEKVPQEKIIFENLINLRKSLENEFIDVERTWKIDLKSKEMPAIYYKYEGQIELIDIIINGMEVKK